MKKSGVFILAALFFLFAFPLILAQANDTQINNGFSCLSNKTSSCSSLTIGEKIFSSLATGQCTAEIESSEAGNGCIPSGSCDIKTTSQAVLALKNAGHSTDNPVSWLLSQAKPTSNIDWFLQIDSNSNATSCTVSYSGTPYTVNINPDKTLDSGAGTCFSLSQNGYWLQVSPSCYGTNFSVSCNQPFTAAKLYQRQDFPTIYVSSSLNSASAGGTLSGLSVNSSCMGTGTVCNYEATLWAALALDYAGKDVSSFIPYLTVMADDAQNQQYLPYSFLYSLTSSSDFLSKLLAEQKTVNGQNYWDQGSVYGPNYDTALALLSLQSQTSTQKSNAVDWLFSVQGSDGCWNNVLNTAFILYAVAGSRATSPSSTTGCTSAGYYCMSSSSCTQSGGSVLQGYTCSGTSLCCSKQLTVSSCSSQGGIICSSNQICGGSTTPAGDTSSGQTCCLSGACTNQQTTTSDCELAGATCKNSCSSSEQSISQSCSLSSQVCCEPSSAPPTETSTLWIWILGGLVAVLLLGLLFRKKLGMLWFRMKGGSGGHAPGQIPPRGPPSFPPQSPMSFQRRPPMIPPRAAPPRQRPTEVNDVLNRLREIGK